MVFTEKWRAPISCDGMESSRHYAIRSSSPPSVCWPTGADLDSDVLYAKASGKPIQIGTD